jgi:conserved repeat domain
VPAVPRSRFGTSAAARNFGGAWTYGNLGFTNNAGGTVQIAIDNPAGTPTFTVVSFMNGPGSGNNDAAASPGDPVDLSVTKSVDRPDASRGDVLTYDVVVTNETAGALSSGYTVTDTLPAGLEIVAGTVPDHCTVSGTLATGQSFSCAEGPLDGGEDRTLQFQVRITEDVPPGMTLVNRVEVLGNEEDPVAENNSDEAETRVGLARLDLTKSVSYDDANDNGNPDVGETVTWTFVVRNSGTYDAEDVSITDPAVPAVTPAQQDVPAGEERTFTATTTVSQELVDSGGLTNVATASGTVGGASYTTPTSSATITVRSFPELEAVKSASLVDTNGNGVADPGESVTYTVTVRNTGNVTLTDVAPVDEMVSGFTPASVDLAPQEEQEFVSEPYVVTEDDAESTTLVNVATATGTAADGSATTSPEDSVTVSVSDPEEPPVTEPREDDDLALTGAEFGALAVLATALLVVGAVLVVARRRES